MKYIKLFENFEDIHKICKKYGIKNYTINSDGSIDVDGDVILHKEGLTKLPLNFNNISGYFNCSNNKLISLEGAPRLVGGYFDCSDNQLTTLEGGPQLVGGSFYCHANKLTTLEGSPKSVDDDFWCNYNKLTTLEGGPKSVSGNFWIHYNSVLSFEGAPNHVGDFYCHKNPIENIWDLFQDYSKVELLNDLDPIRDGDLLMDRFNTFLSMIGKDDVESVKGYNCIN